MYKRQDQETNKISGGLVIIGGAVALFNPIAGLGIAVKGLLPSITAGVSKSAADYIGGKLRGKDKQQKLEKIEKETEKAIKQLKPDVVENPHLRSLEIIFSGNQSDFDPHLDERNWSDQVGIAKHVEIVREAISQSLRNDRELIKKLITNKVHRDWLEQFIV